jgi:Flp pilus assembly protein TadB
MFENYKLKKAKAKLELESVNKQLAEIEAQKEKERWEQMPQWERNIEIEKLRGSKETRSNKHVIVISIIWAVFVVGFVTILWLSIMPLHVNLAGWLLLGIVCLVLVGWVFGTHYNNLRDR